MMDFKEVFVFGLFSSTFTFLFVRDGFVPNIPDMNQFFKVFDGKDFSFSKACGNSMGREFDTTDLGNHSTVTIESMKQPCPISLGVGRIDISHMIDEIFGG
jgi:hypothetical protein